MTNISVTGTASAVVPLHNRGAPGPQLSRIASLPPPTLVAAVASRRLEAAVDMMHTQAAMFIAAAADLEVARRENPSWFTRYDDGALEQASAAELIEMMSTAPNGFGRGMVYGAFMARIELAAATGEKF